MNIEEKYGKVKGTREVVMDNNFLVISVMTEHFIHPDKETIDNIKTIKLKELIKQLQKLEKEHGNVDKLEKEHGNVDVTYEKDTWHSKGLINTVDYCELVNRVLLSFDKEA